MGPSSIAKQPWAADTPFARLLGARIRRLREERGLSQAQMGRPMTRAHVSLVEAGRVLPSLPALLLIAARLGVEPGELLPSTWRVAWQYTGLHDADLVAASPSAD